MMQIQPPRCILFVDFDGVTHPDPCDVDQLFTKLPLIEEVLREFQACSIVISSSWKAVHPFAEMREYFSGDMRRRVIGVTPEHSALRRTEYLDSIPSYARQVECEAWLRDAQVGAPQSLRARTPWVAVDDRESWFRPGCVNLLAVNSETGFSPENAVRLAAMLKERMP